MKWENKVFWFWIILSEIFIILILWSPNEMFRKGTLGSSALCLFFGWWLSKDERDD